MLLEAITYINVDAYINNPINVANLHQQRRLPNLQLHRRLPQPLQRRLLSLHNAPRSNTTPRIPTSQLPLPGAVSGPGPGLAVSPSDDSSAGSQQARLSPLPASPPADG